MIPSTEECISLLKRYCAFDHIIDHSKKVSSVAYGFAEKMHARGILVDPDLVRAGGLLHDIAKSIEIMERAHGKKLDHIVLGQLILDDEGYPELGRISARHGATSILDARKSPETWEEKLVYYADLRVVHDTIVPVRERMDYLVKTYPSIFLNTADKILEQVILLEGDIASKSGMRSIE